MTFDRALKLIPHAATLTATSIANYDGGAWYVRATYVCRDCDGTGETYEPCACVQCEYDNAHARYLPCPSCAATGMETRAVTSFREPFSAARFINRWYAERG